MKNKLQKWPNRWIEHITKTCFFYFEDKDITFIDERISSSSITIGSRFEKSTWGITLTLEKNNKNYDIFIKYKEPFFTIHYYYKEYGRMQATGNNINFTMDTSELSSDQYGFFYYSYLGAEEGIFKSAYDIVKSIEHIINKHNSKDNDDNDNNDDDEGENDPIKPFSPYCVEKPELTCH